MKNNPLSKRKEAVALSYNLHKQNAPKVIAKGKGLVADNIIDKALESGIPIQEDPTLVELLSTLNLQEEIPENLYAVVAEIFAFIYQIDEKYGKEEKD